MNDKAIIRPNYFSGEALLTDDFKAEQQFHIDLLRYNNASLRTHGIAQGLTVQWQQGINQVRIEPGMALDCLGREIILLQPKIIKLEGLSGSDPYFLTINYHEVYADYVEQPDSGIKGYKRIVAQPQFRYVKIAKETGLNIILAVISVGPDNSINELNYKSGKFQRRYVDSIIGGIQFVTQGTGIDQQRQKGGHSVLKLFAPKTQDQSLCSIVAKPQTCGTGNYLQVNAQRTQFMGALSTRGNIGIGIDQPLANLQIEAVIFKAKGTLSSVDQQVTFTGQMLPFLAVNDIVISDPQVQSGPQQVRKVSKVFKSKGDDEPTVFEVEASFDPPLENAHFTYQRGALANFSTLDKGNLLQINLDGSVGLGSQSLNQAGQENIGHNALYISADRKVGIGLAGDEPSAQLDVKGAIEADALSVKGNIISDGTVKANSFEGNGEKLKNLPILSFWVKESVGQQASKIHYTQGNVGIQMVNPPASLSVGGGRSQVGQGFVSSDSDNTLIGNQTRFKSEVSLGDIITVGKIVPQPVEITKINSDTELEIAVQVPFVVSHSSYKTLAKADDDPVDGAGTLSSNGTIIIGTNTQFKSLKVGEDLIVDKFVKGEAAAQNWLVESVTDDTHMTLMPHKKNQGKSAFFAKDSAFMITAALMTQIQASAEFSVLTSGPGGNDPGKTTPLALPPAMLVTANGIEEGMAPNTVAINVKLNEIENKYALQVNGDVNFKGTGHFDKLSVDYLTVHEKLTVSADGNEENIMVVGVKGETPRLNVSKINVQIGHQQDEPSDYALDVEGDIQASGKIDSGSNITAAGTVSGNAIKAESMQVAGTQIFADKAVSIIGERIQYQSLTASNATIKGIANTDGFIVVNIGDVNDAESSGIVTGTAALNGQITATAVAACVAQTIVTNERKKGSIIVYTIVIPSSFTMPVRKGEDWTVTLVPSTYFPNNEVYFVPFGTVASGSDVARKTSGAVQFSSYIPDMIKQLQSTIVARRTTEEDLTKYKGQYVDALNKALDLKSEPANRTKLLDHLGKVVCFVNQQTGMVQNSATEQDVDRFITTISDNAGKRFTSEQIGLLKSRINALIPEQDGDNHSEYQNTLPTNIRNLNEALASVLGIKIDKNNVKLLARTLGRLAGNIDMP